VAPSASSPVSLAASIPHLALNFGVTAMPESNFAQRRILRPELAATSKPRSSKLAGKKPLS
jgi:hypothetical protein